MNCQNAREIFPELLDSRTAATEQLEARAKADGAKLVECSAFYPYSRAEEVAQRIGGVPLRLPTQPGEEQAEGAATDLFAMFDAIFSRLEAASREAGKRP